MLKVEDVQAITDYCRVQDQSGRAAARVFQRSRNTIAKVLKEGVEGFRRKKGRRREPRVLLERHQAYIDGVLQGTEGGLQIGKQKHNGITISNHLRAELDYEGSVSQVRRYIQRRSGELGQFKGAVTLDRVKEPNGISEADWTQVKIFLAGTLTTIWLFVLRFRFSGAHFVRGYRAIDAESLRDGLQRGFEWFGGVCPVVQLDNQKAAVVKILKGRTRKESRAAQGRRSLRKEMIRKAIGICGILTGIGVFLFGLAGAAVRWAVWNARDVLGRERQRSAPQTTSSGRASFLALWDLGL